MCRRVECSQCGKPSFAGCGAHVEQVLGDVPRDDRCRCREEGAPAKKRPLGDAPDGSWLHRWLGSALRGEPR